VSMENIHLPRGDSATYQSRRITLPSALSFSDRAIETDEVELVFVG